MAIVSFSGTPGILSFLFRFVFSLFFPLSIELFTMLRTLRPFGSSFLIQPTEVCATHHPEEWLLGPLVWPCATIDKKKNGHISPFFYCLMWCILMCLYVWHDRWWLEDNGHKEEAAREEDQRDVIIGGGDKIPKDILFRVGYNCGPFSCFHPSLSPQSFPAPLPHPAAQIGLHTYD